MSVLAQARAVAYEQTSVMTAKPGRLVVMLCDGARPLLAQAASALREDDAVVAHQGARHAEDTLSELLATLDHERGREIASRLQGIHDFCLGELSRARVDCDPARIDFVHHQLGGLREAWAQIARS